MIYFILGVLLLLLVYGGSSWYQSASPAAIKRAALSLGAGLLFVVALFLLFTGRIGAAVAFGAGAFGVLMRLRQAWGLFSFFKKHMPAGGGSQDNRSTVETGYLKMTLNHEKGHLDGEVLKGLFQGRRLSALSLDQLREKYEELVREDAESMRLLESFLDKAHAHWRAEKPVKRDMNEEEALNILGLRAGAGAEDIKAAHKKLMKQLHPDSGGNTYLAAKINEARDFLLSKLGSAV